MRNLWRPAVLACVVLLFTAARAAAPAFAEAPCTITATVVNKATGAPATGIEWISYSWNPVTLRWDYSACGGLGWNGGLTAPVYNATAAGKAILVIHGIDSFEDYAYKDICPASLYDDWMAPLPDVPDDKSYATATRIAITPGATVSLGTLKLTPKAAALPGKYGAIRGRVTEGFSGKPFLVSSVEAYRAEGSGDWYFKKRVDCAADGSYIIEGTENAQLIGEVRLVMRASAFSRAYADTESEWSGRSLFIGPNTTVYGVDQSITIGGRLSGSVISAESKAPIVDGAVSAYRWDVSRSLWDCCAPDDTDASGRYFLPASAGMSAGTYKVGVFDRQGAFGELFYGQSPTLDNASSVSLSSSGFVSGLDIYMSKKPAVAGRVVNQSGVSLCDIMTEVYRREADGAWALVGHDYTDQNGRWSVLCPSAGTYTVRYVDQAGTTDASDDSSVFLGGAADLAAATRLTVSLGRATVAPVLKLTPVDSARTSRVWGSDRYSTAIAASRDAFPAGETTTVVLATGENFPDALSASGLAGAVDGPVLLTKRDTLYRGLLSEFDRLGVKKVYILGSTAAISAQQEGLIRALGYTVERIAGADRYATSAAVAREVDEVRDVDSDTPVFVARGDSYPDALAVAPAAFAADGVVLLVGPKGASASVASAVSALGLKSGYVVGGQVVLPDASLAGLNVAGLGTERIAGGKDRYETAVQFADAAEARGWLSFDRTGVATGAGFADTLGAGAALGASRGVLLLTERSALSASTAQSIGARADDIKKLSLYGGPVVVKSPVLIELGSR